MTNGANYIDTIRGKGHEETGLVKGRVMRHRVPWPTEMKKPLLFELNQKIKLLTHLLFFTIV